MISKLTEAPKIDPGKVMEKVRDPIPTIAGQYENHREKTYLDIFYNKQTKEYCGRTCKSWLFIISYAIMYLLFVTTFTLLVLYVSLVILKSITDFKPFPNPEPLMYPIAGVGLTAIPTSESDVPLIWYKNSEKDNYEKYVRAIDKFLLNNSKRNLEQLGPCGRSPYGYGENPCVIFKINKQFQWSGKPLQFNSTLTNVAPVKVRKWMKTNSHRLWLECSGYHSYDKEHIGTIKYYPDPPGFDPDVFPLPKDGRSPLVAAQISDFTKGISLAIECKLWYEDGPSSVNFLLYVAPNDSLVYTGQPNFNE